MLHTPEVRSLLRQVDEQPSRTLTDLLGFMTTFNLRFGVAQSPEQVAAYTTLYEKLDALRDQVVKQTEADTTSPYAVAQQGPERHKQPQEFFKGMEPEHFQPHEVPAVPQTRQKRTPAPAQP